MRLLVPQADPATLDGLAAALFTTIPDLLKAKPLRNAVKCVEAVAHILQEMQKPIDEDRLVEIINEKVGNHNETNTDPLPELEEIRASFAKIANTIDEIKQTVEVIKTTSNNVDETINSFTANNGTEKGNVPMTYKSALMGAPIASHLDPRIRAREGIKTRQIKISISTQTQIANLSDTILIERMNNALEGGQKIYRVLRNSRLNELMVETTTDEAATWLKNEGNLKNFLTRIEIQGDLKLRLHNIIASFVPTTFNPDNERHLFKFFETNEIDNDSIVKMHWAKPIERRRKDQVSAHLIITTNKAEIANELILKGAFFCNYRATIEKCGRTCYDASNVKNSLATWRMNVLSTINAERAEEHT